MVRDGEEVVWFAAADQAEAVGTARLEAARAGAVLLYVQVTYTYCPCVLLYWCMRPYATSVCGLKLLVYEALNRLLLLLQCM